MDRINTMISRVGFFLLGLLCLPTAASAAIVNIEYTAHIYNTTGDGLGYQNGDSITGFYVIDTSKAEGKIVDKSTEIWLYGSVDSGLLQSNFAAPDLSGYVDYVRAYESFAGKSDQLLLDKVLKAYGFTLESLGVNFEFNGLDWISDLTLNNINLVSNEVGLSTGGFSRWDLTNWTITDSAGFQFDSITITSLPASVPEPAPLVLLSIVLAALVVRRRFI